MKELKEILKGENKIFISGIENLSQFVYVISKIYKDLNSKILIITENIKKSEIVLKNLKVFLSRLKSEILYRILNPYEDIKKFPYEIYKIFEDKYDLYILPLETALLKVPTIESLQSKIIRLKKSNEIDLEDLKIKLVDYGYKRVEKIYNKGEFAIRGDIIDIYNPLYENPIRIELFDNIIENINFFDLFNQTILEQAIEILLVPYEIENISFEIPFLKIFEPSKYLVILNEESNIKKEANAIFYNFELLYSEIKNESEISLPSPENFLLCEEEFESLLENFKTINIQTLPLENQKSLNLKFKNVKLDLKNNNLLEELNRLSSKGFKIKFIGSNKEKLNEISEKISGEIEFKEGEIEESFISYDFKEIFLKEEIKKYEEAIKSSLLLESLFNEKILKDGDYVVHIENGIGIYRGFKHFETENLKGDFIEIEYANGAKMLLPAEKINLIHKYIGDRETPPVLSQLGTNKFKNIKKQVEKSIESVAVELVNLYAIRQSQTGFKFPPDNEWQNKFESEFIYNETPDQLKAMEEIKRDMESEKPMDRLICGDSGYGKTELAMRASFKAVMSGKQVALLCPTTILAYQHFQNFKERFKNYPVKIEMLSRFTSNKDSKRIIKELADGKIDIIIGTHSIIQDNVKFLNLGLLIIDEEHRFGVIHKEKLRMLKANVDTLTLSATPIPRTLYMSLAGIRDISLVNTPPEGRKPILTKIVKFSPDIIKNAIEFELKRNGQAFFLHNRVQSIEAITNYLKRLIPDAKFTFIHGQMDEDELEIKILEFLDKKYDVLVCTNIIASGIDMPNVNTILINRADCFGLADLYQLRGRVGRSDKEAYAYLLIPSEDALTETAKKRLLTIFEYSDSGTGYNIALRDLEIRGAGNIFGTQQHGNILAVGLELYSKILKNVIDRLKGIKIEEEIEPEIDIGHISYIPDKVVPSNLLKMEIYKNLNKCQSLEELTKFYSETKNRFKELQEPFENLFKIQKIKIIAKKLKITKIKKISEMNYEAIIELHFNSLNYPVLKNLKKEFFNFSLDGNVIKLVLEKKEIINGIEKFLTSFYNLVLKVYSSDAKL